MDLGLGVEVGGEDKSIFDCARNLTTVSRSSYDP